MSKEDCNYDFYDLLELRIMMMSTGLVSQVKLGPVRYCKVKGCETKLNHRNKTDYCCRCWERNKDEEVLLHNIFRLKYSDKEKAELHPDLFPELVPFEPEPIEPEIVNPEPEPLEPLPEPVPQKAEYPELQPIGMFFRTPAKA